MPRLRSIALAVILLTASLLSGTNPVAMAATTSGVPDLLVKHVDLGAHMNPNGTTRAFDPSASCLNVSLASTKLFDTPPPEEHGWKALANVLQALTPSVDTDIPLTASQITSRIASMLDNGQNQQALDVIEKRLAQDQAVHKPGTDVQLMFLHGRALAALDRANDAIALYRHMTTLYPELPEPWNNLAAEYVKQDKLAMAQDALHMALTADPEYTVARDNLGQVQLMLAKQSFQRASQPNTKSVQSEAAKPGSGQP